MDEMVSHAEAKSIRPLTETIQQKSGSGFSELLASPFGGTIGLTCVHVAARSCLFLRCLDPS